MRKRELGDSFEMVLDPFMFNTDLTALADIANALIDTGATKTCIGLDVVQKLQLTPIRTETIDTATTGNEVVGVYRLLLSLYPGHFMDVEAYGIPNRRTAGVLVRLAPHAPLQGQLLRHFCAETAQRDLQRSRMQL